MRVAQCPACMFIATDMDKDIMQLLDVTQACPSCGGQIKFINIEQAIVPTNKVSKDKPNTERENVW